MQVIERLTAAEIQRDAPRLRSRVRQTTPGDEEVAASAATTGGFLLTDLSNARRAPCRRVYSFAKNARPINL